MPAVPPCPTRPINQASFLGAAQTTIRLPRCHKSLTRYPRAFAFVPGLHLRPISCHIIHKRVCASLPPSLSYPLILCHSLPPLSQLPCLALIVQLNLHKSIAYFLGPPPWPNVSIVLVRHELPDVHLELIKANRVVELSPRSADAAPVAVAIVAAAVPSAECFALRETSEVKQFSWQRMNEWITN